MKRNFIFLLGALLAIGSVAYSQNSSSAISGPIKVSGGLIQGISGSDRSITVFKGIPYAAPPVGELRWRAPQPVLLWDGLRKADKFSPSCIQKVVYERKPWTYEFMTHTDISEDCLYLNVWTPAKTSAEKLPVYVYIFGGANVEGSGAVPVYDGEGLAKKGVIVVTLNYRVGIFGFLAHPELTAEAPYHASGNYAELDIVAALKWVQQNIDQLGGDPAKVTVGGQSAGAGHVFSMTVTPLAKGLFRGAISQSSISMTNFTATSPTLAQAEAQGVKFAEAKGAKSIADLRRLSWQEILDPVAPTSPGARPPAFYFVDVIDGYVFPASPREIFEQGKQNDVPTLRGLNRNDNSGPAPHPDITLAQFKKQAETRYGGLADEFFKLYPASNDEEAKVAYTESTWDYNRTGTYQWSDWRAKTAKTKVYSYFWDHAMPGPDADKFGAFHTSEIPYVFNTLYMSDRPLTDVDRKIADTLSSYWVNFIKAGTPNGPGLAHWPSTSEAPGMTMEIGEKYGPVPVACDKAKFDFFAKYYMASLQTAHP